MYFLSIETKRKQCISWVNVWLWQTLGISGASSSLKHLVWPYLVLCDKWGEGRGGGGGRGGGIHLFKLFIINYCYSRKRAEQKIVFCSFSLSLQLLKYCTGKEKVQWVVDLKLFYIKSTWITDKWDKILNFVKKLLYSNFLKAPQGLIPCTVNQYPFSCNY